MNGHPRDIDQIIDQVSQRLPGVNVRQHWVKNPTVDDNGVWFFYWQEVDKQIQLESSKGACPFMVEHDDMKSSSEAEWAATIEEAVEKVVAYLSHLKKKF